MVAATGRTPGVDSARRALQVLLLFSEERTQLTANEIAQETDISLPSAYRFISLLREMDLVDENGDNSYVLSPRIFSLARSAEQSAKVLKLVHPLVERLSARTGEAALFIRRAGDFATCTELSQTDHPFRLSFTPGHIMSLHRGAGAKILLAQMGRNWAQRYLERIDPPITGPAQKALLKELDTISAQGWAKSTAEVDEGVWAVAAPITMGERVIGAVSVAGPQFRIDDARGASILDEVVSGAVAVSVSLRNNS